MAHEQRLTEDHRHGKQRIVHPSVGHLDAPKHQQRGCQHHQQRLDEQQSKELTAAASVHLHHVELFRAVEIRADKEVEEVEQPHQQDEHAHAAGYPTDDGQLLAFVRKLTDGKHLYFVIPAIQIPAEATLRNLPFQLPDVGMGCQQGIRITTRHLVALFALQKAVAVVQHQYVHRFHEVEGIVLRCIVHDGLHGIDNASVGRST